MPIIYIDGPEKAGKTTFSEAVIAALEEWGPVTYRHWGKWEHDSVVLPALREDVASSHLCLWDRGWLSDSAYGPLLGRDCRLGGDWWLGQWLYGRAVQTVGYQFVLLGPPPEILRSRRSADDLPVDPGDERKQYGMVAEALGIRTVTFLGPGGEEHDKATLKYEVGNALDLAASGNPRDGRVPPAYCGPLDAKVVFVGQGNIIPQSSIPGAWLPFTSKYAERYGRILGSDAFRCGWTNARECNPTPLRDVPLLVACGAQAALWAKMVVGHTNVLEVPHPSWMYRWGEAQGMVRGTEIAIVEAVKSALAKE